MGGAEFEAGRKLAKLSKEGRKEGRKEERQSRGGANISNYASNLT